jgi:hypothetical protein
MLQQSFGGVEKKKKLRWRKCGLLRLASVGRDYQYRIVWFTSLQQGPAPISDRGRFSNPKRAPAMSAIG